MAIIMNDQQKAYQQQMDAQLKQWSAQIDEVKARAEQAEAKAKIDFYNQLEDLRIKENGLRQKLASLRDASEDRWESLKADVELAAKKLTDSIENH